MDRENFGSRATVIMAMAGSAVGLGNIWRFPYMVGENGGAAFIVIYILSSLLLALPIFFSETIIGRASQSNTIGAMNKFAPGTKWKWLGYVTVVSPLIIFSYYSVVGGWSLEYLLKSVTTGFAGHDAEQLSSFFGSFVSSPWMPIVFMSLFMLLCTVINRAGVKSGIERFNKITMPILMVIIIAIAVFSISLPGAKAGVAYMLHPDFSKLSASAIASAMGQSFFSLSLGVGTILTYSSYVKRNENIFYSGLGTAGFDLLFALISGFAIMPAVFAAGIAPGAGPGLIYETLPYVFSNMADESPVLSGIIAILFFVTIVFAALTSAISMFEVGVAYLVEEKHFNRTKATAILLAATWVLGCLCSLSFGPLSNFTLLGETLFNFFDKLVSNYLMALGGLLFVLFVGWKMKKDDVRAEFTNNGTQKQNVRFFNTFWFLVKYVAPIGIVLIFVTNLIFQG